MGQVVVLQCDGCGVQFERPTWRATFRSSYCSHACYLASPRKDYHRLAMSRSRKGKPPKNLGGNGGYRPTEEVRQRISATLKGRVFPHSFPKGSAHPTWKGGLVARGEGSKGFHCSREYRQWRSAVLERDGRRCVQCGSSSEIQVDHIKPYALFPELALDVANGRVLCGPCHRATDTHAGRVHTRRREEWDN